MGEHVCPTRENVDDTGTALCRFISKTILRLECGLLACAIDVISLILIDIRDLRPLDSFGILLTSNGMRWFPRLRTIVKRTGIALSHSATKRTPSLNYRS
jgi:hypothetical protein